MKDTVNKNYVEFNLHYFLVGDNKHSMDAQIFNECEKNMLFAIKELDKYLEEDIKIDIVAKKEGGVESDYLISVINSPITIIILTSILNAWANNFFAPKKDENQVSLNKIELLEKLKQGTISQDEFDFIASDNKELMSFKSNFYKVAQKELSISKIETNLGKDKEKSNNSTLIKFDQFEEHILEKITRTRKKEIKAKIYIASPILIEVPKSKKKWEGIFNNTKIDFTIKDIEFLEDVYNQKMNFRNGTTIFCKLLAKITETNINNVVKETTSYVVEKVESWEDGEHFKFDGKILKIIDK